MRRSRISKKYITNNYDSKNDSANGNRCRRPPCHPSHSFTEAAVIMLCTNTGRANQHCWALTQPLIFSTSASFSVGGLHPFLMAPSKNGRCGPQLAKRMRWDRASSGSASGARWGVQFQSLTKGSFQGREAKLLKKCTETFWVCLLAMNKTAQMELPLNERLVKGSSGVGCQIGRPMGVLVTLAKQNAVSSLEFYTVFCLLLCPLIRISVDPDRTHRPLSHFY